MLISTYKYILIAKGICLGVGGILLATSFFQSTKKDIYSEGSQVFVLDTIGLDTEMVQNTITAFTKYAPSAHIGIVGCNKRICAYIIPPTQNHTYILTHISYLHEQTLRDKDIPFDAHILVDDTITVLTKQLEISDTPLPLQKLVNQQDIKQNLALPYKEEKKMGDVSGGRWRAALFFIALGI